jgi:hypothetical protein
MELQAKRHETFRLDAIDSDRLRKVAKRKGIQRTALIRDIVVRYLDREDIAQSKTKSVL